MIVTNRTESDVNWMLACEARLHPSRQTVLRYHTASRRVMLHRDCVSWEVACRVEEPDTLAVTRLLVCEWNRRNGVSNLPFVLDRGDFRLTVGADRTITVAGGAFTLNAVEVYTIGQLAHEFTEPAKAGGDLTFAVRSA